MHRIDGPAAAPGNLFTDGDPNVGTPATVVTDDWLNAVQEEIGGVVEGAGIALSKPSNAQLLAAINVLISRGVPAGAVQAFAMAAVPTGWLACDGALKSRAAYPALFAAVGVVYGAGDGSTSFALPDLRGEFLRGLDGGRGVDAGRSIGTAQADEFKAHSHMFHGDDYIGTAPGSWSLVTSDGVGSPNDNSGGGTYRTKADLATPGGTETRPRNIALLFCIRT